MRKRHLCSLIIVALVVWVAAAADCGAQVRSYNETHTDDAVTEYDMMPRQPFPERIQKQTEVFTFGPFHVELPADTTGEADAPHVTANATIIDALLDTAFKYIGVRYRSGQSGPNGFDCSGFTSFVYRQHNIHLTHSSRAQYNEGAHIHDIAQLQKGDLVFFGGSSRRVTSIGHVGIVTEVAPNGKSFKFIHASTSSGIKVDTSLDPYYTSRYVGACRVIQ